MELDQLESLSPEDPRILNHGTMSRGERGQGQLPPDRERRASVPRQAGAQPSRLVACRSVGECSRGPQSRAVPSGATWF